jgi:hypothetical protein
LAFLSISQDSRGECDCRLDSGISPGSLPI